MADFKAKLSPDHAKVELDGNPTSLEALQISGVRPDEMVRYNKRLYMNGVNLNGTGAEWESLGIALLAGPTVSDGISKPVVVADLGFNPQDPEIAKLLKEDA